MMNKLKVIQVNSFDGGSTGRIARSINKMARENGWDTYFYYGRIWKNKTVISDGVRLFSIVETYLHIFLSRLFDCGGLLSVFSTLRLIARIDKINPDIVHLHNVHGYYLNYPILFSALKKRKINVVWTLHDCWTMTGHCPHFERISCDKWKSQCYGCPLKSGYPRSILLDNSRINYKLKKRYFTGNNRLFLVSVSSWLDEIRKKSFLSAERGTVIHNGVDTDIFRPVVTSANNRLRPYVLGVAAPWSEQKGLNDFMRFRELLEVDIDIILVGLDDKQIATLPNGIIGIKHTNSREELVALYSSALAYVNLTYEDNFPTTNVEALACGTPVITYRTGGCAEAIDEKTGFAVEKGDMSGLLSALKEIVTSGRENYTIPCRKRAVEHFNSKTQYSKYVDLYSRLIENDD